MAALGSEHGGHAGALQSRALCREPRAAPGPIGYAACRGHPVPRPSPSPPSRARAPATWPQLPGSHAARPTRRPVGFSKPPPWSPLALTALRSRTPSLASCSSDTNLVVSSPRLFSCLLLPPPPTPNCGGGGGCCGGCAWGGCAGGRCPCPCPCGAGWAELAGSAAAIATPRARSAPRPPPPPAATCRVGSAAAAPPPAEARPRVPSSCKQQVRERTGLAAAGRAGLRPLPEPGEA